MPDSPPPLPPTPPPLPPPGPDLTGRTLGDYRILRCLGQGGMGQVYLAEQLSLGRRVAFKVLRPDLAQGNPTALQRFKQEASSLARLTHANIVQVHAIGEAEGFAFMVLEYVEGRNLRDHLARKGSPDVLLILSIMRQVTSALQRAAEMGIVHRDIKPENILLNRKGEVKVADFGLARYLAPDQPPVSLTQSGITMGTPLYMSPEQVEGKPLDVRTDIYSFGVTCYHMVAGHPPFQGSTPFEVALQHVRGEPKPLAEVRPDLPPGLHAVIHKMMARDPTDRYQTARDLLRDLARVRESLSGQTTFFGPLTASDGSDVVAGPAQPTMLVPAPSTQTIRPPRRRGLAVLFVLSLLLAAGGGAAFAWYQRQSRRPDRPVLSPPPEGSLYERLVAEPARSEQQLRSDVELQLKYPKNIDNVPEAFNRSLDLGLLYLESGRLAEAEDLFRRLDGLGGRLHSLQHLGHLGLGIVLALTNRARESNRLFREAFEAPVIQRIPERRLMGKQPWPPELQVWRDRPLWRYWMARAVNYNLLGGVPEEEVPLLLRRMLPGRWPWDKDKGRPGGK
jgi:serine/threonine protein kinase